MSSKAWIRCILTVFVSVVSISSAASAQTNAPAVPGTAQSSYLGRQDSQQHHARGEHHVLCRHFAPDVEVSQATWWRRYRVRLTLLISAQGVRGYSPASPADLGSRFLLYLPTALTGENGGI